MWLLNKPLGSSKFQSHRVLGCLPATNCSVMTKMIKWPLRHTDGAGITGAAAVRVLRASMAHGNTVEVLALAALVPAARKIGTAKVVSRAVIRKDVTAHVQTRLMAVIVSRVITGEAEETMVAAMATTTNLAGSAEKETEMVS